MNIQYMYKYSGYDNCTNSSDWWPKDRNLNHKPPKDRNLNSVEAKFSIVEYLNWQNTDNDHHHSLLYTYLDWDNSTE